LSVTRAWLRRLACAVSGGPLCAPIDGDGCSEPGSALPAGHDTGGAGQGYVQHCDHRTSAARVHPGSARAGFTVRFTSRDHQQMSSSAVAFRSRPSAYAPADAQTRERWVRRRVSLAWSMLFLNVLTFSAGTWNGLPLLIPIPSVLGKMITQGALPLAFVLALTANRRLVIRPNVFLCLLSLLVVEALVSGVHPLGHFTGTLFRTCRLTGFVATLWLLTPWWGRRDLLLLRTQLVCLSLVLCSVLPGLLVAPGRALAQGRLSGTLWPMPPTEVADLAAVTVGLVVLLWLADLMRGRIALLVGVVATIMLLLTHSRTSLIGMTAGILVAGLSLFTAKAKVRKLFVTGAIIASIAVTVFSGVLITWLSRGENSKELTTLTGRTSVWTQVLNAPRDVFQMIFGFGLSNKSFNGFPVDSNWLAAYLDLGLLGVATTAVMLLFVLVSAYFQPRGPQRAVALFLVTYLLVTSITATGLSDASIALLELSLAASLVVTRRSDRLLL
jgi:hypothetical protein